MLADHTALPTASVKKPPEWLSELTRIVLVSLLLAGAMAGPGTVIAGTAGEVPEFPEDFDASRSFDENLLLAAIKEANARICTMAHQTDDQ